MYYRVYKALFYSARGAIPLPSLVMLGRGGFAV